MSAPLTSTTRELACLALGHEDSGAPRCPESDEVLVAQLVAEVQALRVAAGVVEATEVDRAEAAGALDEALGAAADAWTTGPEQSTEVLARLADLGWQLLPIRRP